MYATGAKKTKTGTATANRTTKAIVIVRGCSLLSPEIMVIISGIFGVLSAPQIKTPIDLDDLLGFRVSSVGFPA